MSPLNKYPILRKILFFFPAQLVLVHIQRNFLIMFFWAFLVALVKGWWGIGLGIRFLFLEPEYLGTSGFWAFFIVGLTLGGFISAFNLSSYLINSRRFPFLATLRRPFYKYCINNAILPVAFLALYVYELYLFKNNAENLGQSETFLPSLLGLMAGVFIFIFVLLGYFFAVNNDLKRIFGIDPEDLPGLKVRRKHRITRVRTFRLPKQIVTETPQRRGPNPWRTYTYMHSPFLVRSARNVDHYPKDLLNKVFNRNHFNALMFQLITVLIIFIFAYFREVPEFQLPASAAILLVLTLFMMAAGAFQYIFGRWNLVVVLLIFVLLDTSVRHRWITFQNYAYGLDYDRDPLVYNVDSLAYFARNNPYHDEDVDLHRNILENRRTYLEAKYGSKKPPLVFVNVSGGGTKMSLWAYEVLSHLDSVTNGSFFDHVHLISGSSGGMIGAAYYRELYREQKNGLLLNTKLDTLAKNMSSDMLNRIAANIALNDLFIRTGYFTYNGRRYGKDRGWAFEYQLNKNTHGVFNKEVTAYAGPEFSAEIPLLILAPTVVEDGRRMMISAQPVSFLSEKSMPDNFSWHPKMEDLEFMRLFRNHNGARLSMLTALRMNATFPLVLPPVTLPTEPRISLFDAGVRDNYGDLVTIKYLYHLREWLNENCSEIVFLEINDEIRSDHDRYKNKKSVIGLMDGFMAPFDGVISNVTAVQIYNNETATWLLSGYFGGKITHIEMDLSNFEKDDISISFHLTEAEKNRISSSISLPWNVQSTQKAVEILGQ